MKRIIVLLFISTLISCSKKELKIPTLAEKGIQEIQNHSQIWIFFNSKNNDTIANVNSKNTISTTHWIFNIDKRLSLKQIISPIKKLQHKHSNSFHSKEGMHNYFSFSDTISKKLSFIEFDNVEFKTDSILSKYFIKENSKNYLDFNNINLTFNPNNTWINDAKIEKENFKATLLEFIDFSAEGNETMLHLNFNNRLTYQEYLFFRSMIFNLNNNQISTNKIEFIFDQTKVPDCGCE